ncbi:hypothetical protein F5Y16DRAFT_358573 [Xylariaceae sp. FL0255]|nr:hypothetical protein F5Y16DRAFT_358573 [Xylariaceae sp. FL0255]
MSGEISSTISAFPQKNGTWPIIPNSLFNPVEFALSIYYMPFSCSISHSLSVLKPMPLSVIMYAIKIVIITALTHLAQGHAVPDYHTGNYTDALVPNATTLGPRAVTTPYPGQLPMGWVHFCDDEDCSENCGIGVALSNPGCLNEPHRKSLYVVDTQGSPGTNFWAALSHEKNCPCQDQCIALPIITHTFTRQGCFNIKEYQWAHSWRFLNDVCFEADNCDLPPDTCDPTEDKHCHGS